MSEIKKASFHSSSGTMKQLPEGEIPEFAFVGRSNVGKSSLINMLCNNKSLAKTSSTPGKTQTVNLYLINEVWYLADLPGYGYAKVGKQARAGFQKLILDYVTKREQLKHIFVLVDGRISAQKIDMEFVEFLIAEGIAYSLIVTKTDKAKQAETNQMLGTFKKHISTLTEVQPEVYLSSSMSKKGRGDILGKIEALRQS